MLIGIPRETAAGEKRAPITPDIAGKLRRLGAAVRVEAGAGLGCGYSDGDYQTAGAGIEADREALLTDADLILRIRKPEAGEVPLLKRGCIHASHLDPFNEKELVRALQSQGVTALSMEMIPRTTRSQKMDALSSQASLAGYVMALLAASKLPSVFPMMMTPAGTLKPARVFVIGAGVAGLQAIATAKRLGARVTAFDTRPVVAEQVRSLGAKFLEIDLGETGQTAGGYAIELTSEQIAKQRAAQKAVIAESDVVITTAQVFGRKPPVLVTRDMLEAMRPGSVVVDMAAGQGGNVEGSVADETVVVGGAAGGDGADGAGGADGESGVSIIGHANLPNAVCRDASRMYGANVFNLIEDNWDADAKRFKLDLADDILQGCVITHGGEIVNERIKQFLQTGGKP